MVTARPFAYNPGSPIAGTVTSVSFTYSVTEFYCTVCFGFVDQNP